MDHLRKGRPFAVLDLGTGYVKALLIHRGPTDSWSVVGAGIVSYQRPRGATGKLFASQLEAAGEALQRASARAQRLAGRAIRPATCVVAIPAPPAEAYLHRHLISRPSDRDPIARREAIEMQAEVEGAALTAARRHYQEFHPESAPHWLGHFSRAVSVDGHPTTSLEGMRGDSVAFELGVGCLGRSAQEPARWCEELGMSPVLAAESIWRTRAVPFRSGHALLDMGARRTQLVYRDLQGGLKEVNLASGGYQFTRFLSLAASVSPSRAERVKLAYSARRLEEPTFSRTRKVMRRAMENWGHKLAQALGSAPGVMPGRWLSCGGASALPELTLLPGLVAGDSISRLDRYPVISPLAPGHVCRYLAPGPERLGPSHVVSLALADWWLSLSFERAARVQASRLADLARLAGYEVDAGWLRL